MSRKWYIEGYVNALDWVLKEVLPQIEDRADYLHVRKLVSDHLEETVWKEAAE